jgi:hypothetical protein
MTCQYSGISPHCGPSDLARLGCRSLETAAAMVEKPVDLAEQSGTHCALAVVDS